MANIIELIQSKQMVLQSTENGVKLLLLEERNKLADTVRLYDHSQKRPCIYRNIYGEPVHSMKMLPDCHHKGTW